MLLLCRNRHRCQHQDRQPTENLNTMHSDLQRQPRGWNDSRIKYLLSRRVLMNSEPIWTCQQSVDVDVPVAFAWQFMTDVRNWSDPPAEFALDGPFAAGTRGTTRVPGQTANSWVVPDTRPR